MTKYLVIIALVGSFGCATFRHNAVPVAEQLTSLLEMVSREADAAVSQGIMSKADRQEFAKTVMVPSIDAVTQLRACLQTGNCKNIGEQLTILSKSLLQGINTFISKLPNSPTKTKLLDAINSALTFVNELYVKIKTENTPVAREVWAA